MNLFWFLLRSSWIMVALAAFTGTLSGTGSVLLIALINQSLSRSQSTSSPLLWSFLGLAVFTLVTSLVSQFLLASLSQAATYNLRLRLSGWILACPLRHLEELGANRLLATLTDDTLSISIAVLNIPFLCIEIALVLGCLVYLCWLSWGVFMVTLVFLGVAIAVVQFLVTKAVRVFKLAREEQDQLFKHFRAITDGIKELKLHHDRRVAFLTEELQATTASLRDYRVASTKLSALATSFGEQLFFILLALLVFGLPHVTTIPNPVLSGYVLTLTYLTRPLQSILQTLPILSQASVALHKIDTLRLSFASHAETDSTHLLNSLLFTHQINFIQITHSYRREREEQSFTLGPIDLTLYSGELVFIVGGNGSGKSTLAKMITGLYPPESGEIRLDGKLITNQNREAYRQLFATVFSDFYLFERLFGIRLDDLDTQAQNYLKQLQLEQKVQISEGRLSTVDLSQGQRKRLALLTAYLEDRPIYLFDEWASDQDPLFREVFYTQLLLELKQRGKTVLVISHDDRYFHLADRLLKLDYGKLVGVA